jgi:hypothetical protein
MATFFSRATGNWEDGANWSTVNHAGTAGASPGTAGVDYPGSGDTAIISAGHTITVTTDMSALASAVLIQCDAPGTNNGTLKFKPDVNTGLKLQMSTVNSASSINIYAGERLAPVQRGFTCKLVFVSNARVTNGTFLFESWGQHREHGTSDIYCDILAVNASAGATAITLNGDFSPTLSNNEWIWIMEQESSNATSKAQLVQVTNYNSGTKVATLADPLAQSYTTANCKVFRANQKFVNTILAADHASGTDYVLEDDIWPSGTGGGNFLVTRMQDSSKSGTQYLTYSAYNTGTKTITASGSVATASHKGSIVLIDDFNVSVTGTTSLRLGSDTSGSSGKNIHAYTKFDTWSSINCAVAGQILYQTNLFDCKSFNNDTINGRHIYAYGAGYALKSTASSNSTNVLVSNSTAMGHHFIRSRICGVNDSSLNSVVLSAPQNAYFEDVIAHSGGSCILEAPTQCVFIRCAFGGVDFSVTVVTNPQGCFFQDCWIFGARASGSIGLGLFMGQNIFNNLFFGQSPNGRTSNNNRSMQINRAPGLQVFNGVTFDTGEPTPINFSLDNTNFHLPSVRMAKYNGVTNQFRNYTPGGHATHDTGSFKTSAPSVKFNHANSEHPVFFDIPVYLNAGTRTITVWTNPSTGTWVDAPRMLLLAEETVDQLHRRWHIHKSLATIAQATLTTGIWSQLQLTYSVAMAGIYVIRLWARNGSGSVNWDDIGVA